MPLYRLPRLPRLPRLLAVSWWALIQVVTVSAAEDADQDEHIPALGPDVLATWWTRIDQELPHGFASASGSVVDGDDDGAMVDGSAWLGGFWHPTSAWTFGAGAGYSRRRLALGPEFPSEAHHARLPIGAWWRLSLDDHLVVVAIPGLNWSGRGARVEATVPWFTGWFHRANRTTIWGVGLVGIVGERRPLVLPMAGMFLTPGAWNIVLTPVYVGVDRLLSTTSTLGAFVGFSGDATPVEYEGRDRDAVYWDLRLGVRGSWKTPFDATLALEGGWAAIRRANISNGITGEALVEHHLPPSPFAGASLTWSW